MSYFVTPDASSGQLAGAINYILANLNTNVNPNFTTGIVNSTTTTATGPSGQTTAYLYRYLDVAYADNGSGSVNFSSSPLATNRFYGLRNTNSSTYSTNPADYVWYQINGTFSGGNLLWYQTFGGLQINLVVATSAPTINYQTPATATPIDLSVVSTATNLVGRSAYAVTSTSLGGFPTTYTSTGNATFPPDNEWGGSEHWVANPPSYTAGQNVYQIDGIYNPTTNLTLWAAPYLSTLKVGNLSAINANLGTITAGTLNAVTVNSSTINAGTTPPVIDYTNHTISSGAGALINPNGTFALGNPSQNIVDDGSGVYLNGFIASNYNNVSSVNLGVNDGSFHTILTFALTQTSTIIVGTNGYIQMSFQQSTSFTAPQSGAMNVNIQLLNSSNVNVIPGGAYYNLQWTWNNLGFTYVGSPIFVYRYSCSQPISYMESITLPVDTYRLQIEGSGQFYNSSGVQYSGSNPIPTATFNQSATMTSYWYSVNA